MARITKVMMNTSIPLADDKISHDPMKPEPENECMALCSRRSHRSRHIVAAKRGGVHIQQASNTAPSTHSTISPCVTY
jgi:hypothetical protein